MSRVGVNWLTRPAILYSKDVVQGRFKRYLIGLSIAEPGRWEDPTQKLLLMMVAAFAEFEKSLITSRLFSGRKTKARQGVMQEAKHPSVARLNETIRPLRWMRRRPARFSGSLSCEI